MSKLIHTSDATFESEVLQSEVPVLVDFYADWCGPCRLIAPILEEIAEEANGEFQVTKLDVDSAKETAIAYDIQSIPTLILFKDGEPVERWTGVAPKAQILSSVREHVSAVASIER